jgi:hypothetical protein
MARACPKCRVPLVKGVPDAYPAQSCFRLELGFYAVLCFTGFLIGMLRIDAQLALALGTTVGAGALFFYCRSMSRYWCDRCGHT